eukprot:CAMPEP_0172420986 /NCGR_PEP_ID=MMETSP1064-20121228/7275_1 /TAXON_ID=202472 /ORGANISM="Aulacoseira subarctica , Strain CCAP 1002/5" /LENGTH=98 /DNA_ID=CAMNT_0013161161 /DNA_START=1566 /DNA_END=1858 /DNA_ORIENTATION=+
MTFPASLFAPPVWYLVPAKERVSYSHYIEYMPKNATEPTSTCPHNPPGAVKRFQDTEGNTGTSDGHNADLTNNCNQDVQADKKEINKLPQCPINDNLG